MADSVVLPRNPIEKILLVALALSFSLCKITLPEYQLK